uniref:palmitoyl-CoA hydrolase n=1 Tax=Coturnix japonica TaxID=93934 RepID=A0A8C2STN6_COTJA
MGSFCAILGCFGAILRCSWVILGCFQAILGCFGVIFLCFGVILGCFGVIWGVLGQFWGGHFGSFWGVFGPFWVILGCFWGNFGVFWVISPIITDTQYLRWLFPRHMKSNLYRLCYTAIGQGVSICNYWNDPHHRDLYLNSSDFLAPLNDERLHPNASAWKQNLLRIRNLVLIGGPDDGVITPWQSSLFGFYDANETVQDMRSQQVYLADTFGLKTLDGRGALWGCVVPGVGHTGWHNHRGVYERCIRPWLT